MSSRAAARLLLALGVAGLLPACGNINDGHPAVPFTVRVSVSTAGAEANQVAGQIVISANGRFVVFTSLANTLVPGDTNSRMDVFRRDLLTGVTELVSIGVGGVPANNHSIRPTISEDGRWIAFESVATNLTGVAPGGRQIYVRDMNATPGTGIVMVSEASPGVPGDDVSEEPSISADGRFVAFASMATNFGDAHFNGVHNIYRRDLTSATIILISISTALGDPTPGFFFEGSRTPSISADGSRIAYSSDCSDLVALDVNDLFDVFVTTVGAPLTTVMASPGLLGGGAGGESTRPSLSGDGRFVAYESNATDLVTGDLNFTVVDIFVFDVDGGTVRMVSVNSAGFQGAASEDSLRASISFDGRYVAFDTAASNMVDGDTNQSGDVFIKDLVTGAVARVSVDTSNQQGGPSEISQVPSLSADGRTVAFLSDAPFVNGDSNGLVDAYVRSPLR